MTHSKEPWRRGGIFGNPCGGGAVVCDESVNPVAGADDVAYYGGMLVAETVCPADARRIVACVNVLAGVSTEILERVINAGARLSVFDDPSGGLNCDLVEASAPICIDGEATQYQTADAHNARLDALADKLGIPVEERHKP